MRLHYQRFYNLSIEANNNTIAGYASTAGGSDRRKSSSSSFLARWVARSMALRVSFRDVGDVAFDRCPGRRLDEAADLVEALLFRRVVDRE